MHSWFALMLKLNDGASRASKSRKLGSSLCLVGGYMVFTHDVTELQGHHSCCMVITLDADSSRSRVVTNQSRSAPPLMLTNATIKSFTCYGYFLGEFTRIRDERIIRARIIRV